MKPALVLHDHSLNMSLPVSAPAVLWTRTWRHLWSQIGMGWL